MVNRKISKKAIYVLIGIFVFAVLITIGGVRTFFDWSEVNYAGEIIETRNGGFLIKGGGEKQWLIIIMDDTKIRKGREALTRSLQEGEHVIVVGTQNAGGAVEADVIRVAKPPPLKKPKP